MARLHCTTCNVMPTNPAFLYRLSNILTSSYTPEEIQLLLDKSEAGFALPVDWVRVELRLVWTARTPGVPG